MQILNEFIAGLYMGDAVEFGELSITPVFQKEERPSPFLDLEEALRLDVIEVREVSEQGSVPTLLALNKSERDVIILDGEELVGAKQNRIVNTTIVVPARSEVVIPVSCVEQGRWRYSSAGFSTSRNISYASLRAHKHGSVTESLRRTGTHRSDQAGVWGDIQAKMERMAAPSATMSMSDVYASSVPENDSRELEAMTAHQPRQVGYFAFVRGGFAGGDVFGSSDLCRMKLRKLIRSHYLDTLDQGLKFPPLSVEQVIGQALAASTEPFAGVGKGAELRFESGNVQGAWKVVDEFVPHLMIFPKLN